MDNQTESHLDHYLRYYDGLHKPGYAVLVTGEWGTGKSYQVKKTLTKLDSERKNTDPLRPENHIYVSLFGKTSCDEIDLDVVSKMAKFSGFFARLFTGVSSVAVSTPYGSLSTAGAKGMTALVLENQLNLYPANTIVFDDLERSNIRPKILLGVLNRYVEHLGFRVVLIAHHEKIAGNFAEAKEKIIGQTIRIQPQVNEAWQAFVGEQSVETKIAFIKTHRAIILKGFSNSGVNSLRILRHIIEDVGRLHDAMSEKQINNTPASAQLIEWFVTVNSFVRNGTLGREQIPIKYEAGVDVGTLKQQWQVLLDQSAQLGLYDKKLAADMISDGHFNSTELQVALENSLAFSDPSNVPIWITVWNRRRLDFDNAAKAIEKLQLEFHGRKHDDPGVVMHIFALQIDLAQSSLLPGKTLHSIEVDCKTYIEDLASERRLPNYEAFWRGSRSDLDDIESHGYGFMGVVHRGLGDPEGEVGQAVRRLFGVYKNAVIKGLDATIEEKRLKLFKMLNTDVDQFQEAISTGEFRQTPIFKNMEVSEFVDVLLKVPHENWNRVSAALGNRYQAHGNRSALTAELPWLLELDEEIKRRATILAASNELAGKLRADALRWFFPSALREWLESPDRQEQLETAIIAEPS